MARNPSPASSHKTSSENSRSASTTPAVSIRPTNLAPRNPLASLSVAASPDLLEDEKTWPSGWRPYVCLLGGFLLMFNSWGLVNAYGTYSSFYRDHLLPTHDILEFNLVGSTESFWVLIASILVGRLLDAGHLRPLLITGTILLSLGSFLLSVVNGKAHYGQGKYCLVWLTQGTVAGLGMACFFVSSSWVVATWFKKKKGLAVGIVASGASIAGLIYPLMLRFLLSIVNFNNAQRYVAALTTSTAVLAIFIARPNPAHQYRKPDRWSVRVFVDKDALRDAAYVSFVAAICFLFLGFYAIFFTLEEWAHTSGLGTRIGSDITAQAGALQTYLLLSIMNATSTVGRICSAWLCDHFGPLNVHCVVTFIGSLLVLILWTLAKTVPAAICFVVFFGIFSGAVIGLPPASVADILGIHDRAAQTKLGQWTGMMYSTAAVFALTGPVIGGYIVNRYNTFLAVKCWSGVCLFLSATCMAVAIYFKRRKASMVQLELDSLSRAATVTADVDTSQREEREAKEEV